MPKLEVFFDYACPFCLRGYRYLKELYPNYPQIEIEWQPCEAHPRPDSYGPHSDLCIRGMFFVKEHGADLWAYHDRMFQAALRSDINIENPDELAGYVKDLLDAEAFRKALLDGDYIRELDDSNRYSDDSGVWAVPSFRMNGEKLDAVENVGVTKRQLQNFMERAKPES